MRLLFQCARTQFLRTSLTFGNLTSLSLFSCWVFMNKMVREQQLSFLKQDKEFSGELGNVFQKTEDEATREVEKQEDVALWRHSKNEGLGNCERDTRTRRPVTPTVHLVTKKRCPTAVLPNEGLENSEWKNRVKLAFHSSDGNMFNNRTHWNMRCKFLEIGLRMSGLDTIRENPDQIFEKPEGGFFIYIPVHRNKDDIGEETKVSECETMNHKDELYRSNQSLEKSKDCSKTKNGRMSPKENNEYVEIKNEALYEAPSSKPETPPRVDDELVLEDVSEKDLVPEILFPSSRKLIYAKDAVSGSVLSSSSSQETEVCENEGQPQVERSEAEVRVSLSRLERLRRRILKFLNRLRRNRVRPV